MKEIWVVEWLSLTTGDWEFYKAFRTKTMARIDTKSHPNSPNKWRFRRFIPAPEECQQDVDHSAYFTRIVPTKNDERGLNE